jgi:hypothetical protein
MPQEKTLKLIAHLINGAVMLSEAKHPATSNGQERWVCLAGMRLKICCASPPNCWILRFAQNDRMKWPVAKPGSFAMS